jgi:Fic family protein
VRGNLRCFQDAYSPKRLEEPKKLPAFAASHHRLLWIHPFRDGNGRVARLFTIA